MHSIRAACILRILAAILLWGLAAGLQAAGKPTDAVLVIDSSGSMKRTDPQRLRVPAAKLFATLLGDEDRIGILSFSDDGYPVVHLTPPDDSHRARIEAGIDKISARGTYTNLHAAVARGLQMLEQESDPAHRRLLLLLSDGHMDTGDAARDALLQRRLFAELVPKLKAAGVRVYTIAFTEASDLELLQRLAHETGGISRLASNDRALHEVFGAIFETAKSPDMLPIENGEFLVDDAVGEFTVVASKARPEVRIVLEMPDGRRIAAVNAGRAVRWFQSALFDMITVKGPPPGTWRLLAADAAGRNRAYVVTDLSLEAEFAPETPKQGEKLALRAWLQQGAARLTRPEVLAATGFSAEIVPETGEPEVVPLADSGVSGDAQAGDACFSNEYGLHAAGPHMVRIRAESPTFRREKILHLDVLPRPATDTDRATPETAAVTEEDTAAPVEQAPQAAQDAQDDKPEPSPALPEEAILPEEPERPVSVWTLVASFLAINLVLGLGIFGYLYWRRRGKTPDPAEDPADLSWLDAPEEAEEDAAAAAEADALNGVAEAAAAAAAGGESPAEDASESGKEKEVAADLQGNAA